MTREQMRIRAAAIVASWPELSEEQRNRLAVLLRPANKNGVVRVATRTTPAQDQNTNQAAA
jgi:hypothetical protein